MHRTGGRKADNTAGRSLDQIMIHTVMSQSDSYANIARLRYVLRNAD
ncbi:hypothetical protein GNIT_0328 [Glaciecola nitratireducens FR1064]|uniref:Uncharacterized protein n=1 Tax=Glaciecola nitratireducens (strain JCM 12485 / KCTC 12276 / FR1064) TaxID=1085623 RepID=G4QFD8_GLANF|nr:hypothetical protein GNIT_0328 [Glaciecola nitratireducens FR1064]